MDGLDALLLVARGALALVFVAAAIAKLARYDATRASLPAFGVPPRLAASVAVGLPLVELAIAALLVPAVTAGAGAVAAAGALVLFSGALVRAARRGTAADCNCFGRITSARPAPALARNALLVAVAAAIAVAGPGGGLGQVGTTGWLALGGACVAVVQGLVALALFRQNGRLIARVTALEQAADGSRTGPGGLLPGEPAPPFVLPDGTGRSHSLDDLLAAGRPLALVFSDPGCGACADLPTLLARLQAELADELEIALISGGEPVPGPFAPVLYQEEHEVAQLYAAGHMPSALLIDSDGRVDSPLVLGADAIERLLLPPVPEVLR